MASSDSGNAPLDVVAFAGSLRRRSFNRALLRAAAALAPAHMTFEEGDLAAIPVYNADLDETQG
ncbi:MAG: NAD(P)H-dependent oxidoreductase, partial [Actinomycetota bacterium]